jgi:hypothetical protein
MQTLNVCHEAAEDLRRRSAVWHDKGSGISDTLYLLALVPRVDLK